MRKPYPSLVGCLFLSLWPVSVEALSMATPLTSGSQDAAGRKADDATAGLPTSGEASSMEPAGATSQEDADAEDPNRLRAFWDNGLRMETDDGRFQFRVGGRTQYDWTFWGSDDGVRADIPGTVQSGTEFRRARIYLQGRLYENVEFKSQFDFAGGEVAVKDLYIGVRGLPATVRLGHMKEPFGLEELTSSKYITFIERSLPGVFDPSRNSGFLVRSEPGPWDLALGVFRETEDDGIGALPGRYSITGRAGLAVWNRASGSDVLHAGAALSYRGVEDGTSLAFRQRPEVHLAPRFITTGAVPMDAVTLLGLELAWIHGPWSVQSEYKQAFVASDAAADPSFEGFYVFGSYWLTGEHRIYAGDGFGRITPRRNFLGGNGGLGAWEVAVRYSLLDLQDAGVRELLGGAGGRLDNLTIGVNWHWNPMTRLMLNAVRSDLEGSGDIWAVTWRGQVEF